MQAGRARAAEGVRGSRRKLVPPDYDGEWVGRWVQPALHRKGVGRRWDPYRQPSIRPAGDPRRRCSVRPPTAEPHFPGSGATLVLRLCPLIPFAYGLQEDVHFTDPPANSPFTDTRGNYVYGGRASEFQPRRIIFWRADFSSPPWEAAERKGGGSHTPIPAPRDPVRVDRGRRGIHRPHRGPKHPYQKTPIDNRRGRGRARGLFPSGRGIPGSRRCSIGASASKDRDLTRAGGGAKSRIIRLYGAAFPRPGAPPDGTRRLHPVREVTE